MRCNTTSTAAPAPHAPTHRLEVTLDARLITVIVDPVSGRPTAQIDGVTANYQLVEIATGKIVLRDTATAQVDTDSPGSQQRFAVHAPPATRKTAPCKP